MHLLNLMTAGMLWMQSVNWTARMVGVWNSLITLKVVEAVVGVVVVVVRIRSVMSVVNLVTLLVNAARAAHGAWGMGGAGAPVLVAVGVQVMEMGAGATVLMGKDLLGAAAYHLVVVAATAGHLHIVMLVVIHLMLMEIKAVPALEQIWNDI
ncbi:hypothetical protein V6N13_069621 [Hibiscus sabdariffa]